LPPSVEIKAKNIERMIKIKNEIKNNRR